MRKLLAELSLVLLFMTSSDLVIAQNSSPWQLRHDTYTIGLLYRTNQFIGKKLNLSDKDYLVNEPLVWGYSAKLESDIFILLSKGEFILKKGTVLPAQKVTKLNYFGNVLAFCVRPEFRSPITYSASGVSTMTLPGPMWDRGQVCVIDTDNDEQADHAFQIGSDVHQDRVPQKISPVKLNLASFRETGEGDRISIRYTGTSHPTFQIKLHVNGKNKNIQSVRIAPNEYKSKIKLKKIQSFPYSLDIYGYQINITKYNKKEKTSEITFLKNLKIDYIFVE